MRYISFLLLLVVAASCNTQKAYKASFTTVETDTLLQDKISIRAIAVDGSKAWYSGSSGKYGWVSFGEIREKFNGVASEGKDLPEFRAIAQTDADIFILNAGSPAQLYKISKDGKHTKLVYTETGEKVFYDSMQFRDNKNGIAIGDPTDGCMSVIVTKDGGDTWTKIPCSELPAVAEGEAAFAASNSNVIVKKDKTWIVTGGKKSRVLYSAHNAENWKVFDTPIAQGSEMAGMFSADFYDGKIGFAVGGDYAQLTKNTANTILTEDGGKSWKIVSDGLSFGYSSCVQFIPGSHGNELMTAGPSGIFYSFDRGASWKMVLETKKMHTIRFIDSKNAILAGENLILKLNFK